MDKFAGIRPVIPEWYADEIERLEIPRNGTIGEVVLDFILALKNIVKNIKFRKSLRFLQDISRTKLQTLFSSIYTHTNKPLKLEQYGKLNHAGLRLKQLAVEYIYTNNSFYSEEIRNPSELIDLIRQIGKAFEDILNELEIQKELMIQNVNEEEVIPSINQAFRFLSTLKGNIREDVELALKNATIWAEIYSGRNKWNEMTDRNREENVKKRKFKPEKFDDETINSTINNLKNLTNNQPEDEQSGSRGKDSSRFFISFTNRLSDLNKFFVQTFIKSNFSSTASSIAKLINDTGLLRYDKTRGDLDDLIFLARKIDNLRKTGGLAEAINELNQAWNYFQAAIKSGKFPSDESTSIELQRSFEEMMKQMRQLQELVADANLGSYYRRISLAFIEDLTSFV